MHPVTTAHLKKQRWAQCNYSQWRHVELSTIHYMGKSTLFLLLCTVEPNYFFNLKKKIHVL